MQVVANPAITNYTATYAQLYKFTTQVACNPAPCTGVPGTILINGNAAGDASYQSPGASEILSVVSNNGWIFSGWQVGTAPLVHEHRVLGHPGYAEDGNGRFCARQGR